MILLCLQANEGHFCESCVYIRKNLTAVHVSAFSCRKSFEQTTKDALIVEAWRWEKCRGGAHQKPERAGKGESPGQGWRLGQTLKPYLIEIPKGRTWFSIDHHALML